MAEMNALAGRNKLVLYLGYGGVLHHHNVMWHALMGPCLTAPEEYKLFQHSNLLEQLLEPFPTLCIVLSTSWVGHCGLDKAAKHLQPSLRYRVIGATLNSYPDTKNFAGIPRGEQVRQDVRQRQPRAWLALDHNAPDWPVDCLDCLVCTDRHEGLRPPSVQLEFLRKLVVMCEGETL